VCGWFSIIDVALAERRVHTMMGDQPMETNRNRIRMSVAVLAGVTLGAFAMSASNITPSTLVGDTGRGFNIYSLDNAPADSKPVLENVNKGFGFVPNMAAVMAESPALLHGYIGMQQSIKTYGSLTPQENNLVQLAISAENKCQYCTNGHAMMGEKMMGMDPAVIKAARMGWALPDAKEEALRTFALTVYNDRGHVSDGVLEDFLEAGYTRRQALDVVAAIGAKVMSNLTNDLTQTPLDPPFQAYKDAH